ncbi:MAG: tetratricopeptide repeat protein [Candidatus Handelsmanbacteria bacterium]|nr:tetratricopeptide repeat protein [Candidatus Handelsmanbacteria bacterium]
MSRNPVLLCLMALLMLGAGMRWHHLSSYLAKYPDLTADALEYKDYGDYLVGRSTIEPHADRPPGFPLLLGLLYSVVSQQGKSAALQASLGLVFDSLLILLVWWVGRGMCGTWPALVAAFLVALNGELVRCSALSGTEQLYGVVSVLLLACLLRLREEHRRGWFLLALVLGTWLVVIKQEGGLVFGVFAAFYLYGLWRQQRPGMAPALGRSLVLLALPLAAYWGYKYYSSQVLGIPTMDMRTGNALFHAEFLAGKLPWGYMRDLRNEYFQISNADWLFKYHTPVEVAQIIGKSTLLVGRILTEMVGGWPWALLVLAGLSVGLRDARFRPLPALFLAAALPFCLLAEPHSHSSYTPRLLVPVLPFAAMCAALGAAWGAGQLRRWASGRPWLLPGLGAVLGGYFLAVNLGGQTGFGEHPQTSRSAAEDRKDHKESQPSKDLDQLVALGMRLQVAGEQKRARDAFDQVLALAPEYGPAHMGLALLVLGAGKSEEAKLQLVQSLRVAPFYAEAQALLAAVQLKEEEYGAAYETCQRCVERRPDYPPCHFMLAALFLDFRLDYSLAEEHYLRYLDLNYQAHRNYRDFVQKQLAVSAGNPQITQTLAQVDGYLAAELGGLSTPLAWSYMNKGKAGGLSSRVKPDDSGVYYYLGLTQERQGKNEEARKNYEKSLKLFPENNPSQERLAHLRGGAEGGLQPGQSLAMAPTLYQGETMVQEALAGYHDPQFWSSQQRQGH